MEQMQFGGYQFPHNPEQIEIRAQNSVSSYCLPGKGWLAEPRAPGLREVECTGVFYGQNPLEPAAQWQELTAQSGRVQLLFLPGMAPFPAMLQKYSSTLAQDGCVLPYRLLLLEEEVQ